MGEKDAVDILFDRKAVKSAPEPRSTRYGYFWKYASKKPIQIQMTHPT